jgi:CBS domain containing-hemolysin-like protein
MKSLVLIAMRETELPIPGADPWQAHPQDPALTLMTDFRERSSVTIAESAPIDAALEHMKHAGVRCAFAVREGQGVVGLITAYDIVGEKPLRHAQAVAGRRQDILVRDIMLKTSEWQVTDVTSLEGLTAADLRRFCAESSLTHIPVVEVAAEGRQRLRGLISSAKVRRLLPVGP